MRTTILAATFFTTLIPAALIGAPDEEPPNEAPAVDVQVQVEGGVQIEGIQVEVQGAEGFKIEVQAQAGAGAKAPGFLGVSAGAVPAALADQLKLDHGVRLLEVTPDSPAGKAGLKVEDIITQVGEKKVASMLELKDAIMAHKEGDEVKLKVIQEGKTVDKKVTLAARPAIPQIVIPRGGLQIAPNGAFGGGNMRFNFGGGAGRFKMGDQDGSVEVKGEGEGVEVTVWDLSNKIVFEGPWVTAQDKAAPSAKLRKRIERVERMVAGRANRVQPFVIPQDLPRPLPAPRPAPQPKAAPKPAPEQEGEELPKPKVEDGELEKGEPEE